mmetsp:Transcript_94/g.187  ORF Transcript_94/g.187 Transcript_94/m.187 type:complete len:200 (-) Transcript_94:1086-1685(-)
MLYSYGGNFGSHVAFNLYFGITAEKKLITSDSATRNPRHFRFPRPKVATAEEVHFILNSLFTFFRPAEIEYHLDGLNSEKSSQTSFVFWSLVGKQNIIVSAGISYPSIEIGCFNLRIKPPTTGVSRPISRIMELRTWCFSRSSKWKSKLGRSPRISCICFNISSWYSGASANLVSIIRMIELVVSTPAVKRTAALTDNS